MARPSTLVGRCRDTYSMAFPIWWSPGRWTQMLSCPVLIFYPKYRLAHPEHCLFTLSTIPKSGSKYPKTPYLVLKIEALCRVDTKFDTLFTYILSGNWKETNVTNLQYFTAAYRLPTGVSCPDGCVLQWRYKTYNSCVDPCPKAECGFYADRVNPVSDDTGPMDYCSVAYCGTVRCEVFHNCADITITSGAPKTCSPGAQCGPGICACGSGQCCSQYGWCGTTAGHCGAGCKRGYGRCN